MKAFEKVKSKLVSFSEAKSISKNWKEAGETIVFTNGCFDLIHLGHLDYLSKAKDLADKLVVGLNSSDSVKRLKGPARPINSNESRGMLLSSLAFVDLVVVFEEDTPLNLISTVLPDILVKGGDYTRETIVGADEVEAIGGRVEVIPFLEGYSSTSIVTKIQNLSKD